MSRFRAATARCACAAALLGCLSLWAAWSSFLPRAAAEAKPADARLSALIALVESGHYVEAEPGLRSSLATESRARLWLIRVLFETGRYEEVRAQARLLTETAGSSALRGEAWAWLAQGWAAEGEQDRAEQAYRAAISADASALRPQVLLGRLLWERGRRSEAQQPLSLVAAQRPHAEGKRARAEELCSLAMAARAIGKVQEANELFRQAVEMDGSSVDTRLERAQLFLEKFEIKRAADSVQAALIENPRSALGHVLAARVAVVGAGDFATAQSELTRAVSVNPRLAAAYVVRADIALRELDSARADELLDRALAIDPADLEALSVRAAARFLEDDTRGFAEQEARVFALNPRYGRLYGIVAEHAQWEHRYPEITGLIRRGLRVDKDDPQLLASLGLGLLRMGNERAGLAALHKAWERDRFNVHVFNTLSLYDGIRANYSELTAGPFRVRLHKQERAALEPYLVPLLQHAYATMRERWSFTPQGPLRVELYADPAQFSVRTTGMPDAGVQGVSFGKVVTGLSPRGGPYNWGQIVWHELSHVFHLQLSKNRVPRWFTEGLAEYEAALARPEWKREDDATLWQALRAGRLPPLAAMNRAFNRARSPSELTTAYFFAYRAVQYIVERYGWDHMRRLLVALSEGQKLEAAVERVLGLSLHDLDGEFREALAKRLSRFDHQYAPDLSAYEDVRAASALVAQTPLDPELLAGLSLAELAEGQLEAAARSAQTALTQAPRQRLALYAQARVALAQGDTRKAEQSLRELVHEGADGYTLRMLLARVALSRGNTRLAREHAQAAVQFDPERADAHKLLLELGAKMGDESLTLSALRALAELDQHDVLTHAAYLALLVKREAWDAVVREGETALFIAPENASIHLHLGQGYVERGEYTLGLAELDRALALHYGQPGLVRLARARAFLRQQDREGARREVKLALLSDPTLDQRARALIAP